MKSQSRGARPRGDIGPGRPGNGRRHAVLLAEALTQPVREQVEREGADEEQHADGKDGAVLDRPARRIAEADLDDVGGHGFDRHTRIERQPRLLSGRNGDDHGLADGARYGEDTGRRYARKRSRQNHSQRGFHAGRAERVGAFAQAVRHAPQRVFR